MGIILANVFFFFFKLRYGFKIDVLETNALTYEYAANFHFILFNDTICVNILLENVLNQSYFILFN
jgi:hypothetical protein